jgi:hypothetical protein
LLVVLGLSCTASSQSSSVVPSPPRSAAPSPVIDAWDEGVTDYVWSLKVECFCPPIAYTVAVANGSPTDLIFNGEHAGLHGPYAKHFPLTVPDFLELIHQARKDARSAEVVRSQSSDLPQSISIDWAGFVHDDEIKYTVTAFEAV